MATENASIHMTNDINHLTPLSLFATQSFMSTETLVTAILRLITEQLGMRTSFLTEITPADNRNHIIAAHNLEGGCNIGSGIDLPLNETFCSIITSADPPTPVIIADVKYDAVFGTHPAAAASPHIGCFVGIPLILRDGKLFGTLCAVDPQPQAITQSQIDLLIVLTRFVATQLNQDHDKAMLEQIAIERDQMYHTAQEMLREREALVAIASHELKNPLAALLGQAQLLQRHLVNTQTISERDKGRVGIIVGQAQRINAMLSELLDVSQLDAGQMPLSRTPVDLFSIVQRVVDDMYALYAAHTVEIVEPTEPVVVNGDTLRLEQVVRNLVSNAIKYTPQGGHITVSVVSDAPHAVLKIQDTGIGITADALPNLFRRFYRAQQSHDADIGGFGIGLYVVKEIITRHGGAITVTSTPGIGSEFIVQLPLLTTIV